MTVFPVVLEKRIFLPLLAQSQYFLTGPVRDVLLSMLLTPGTSDVPLLTFLAPETLPIAIGNLRPIFALAHQNSPALAFHRSFLI